MNLGYDIAQVLPGLRAEAESRMTETVTVGLFQPVRLPGSLDTVWELTETFYEGIARVKYPYATSSDKVPAGQKVFETKIVISVPSGTRKIPTRAMFRVEESTVDQGLVGRLYRVEGQPQSGQTTAHRYPVVEES